MTPNEAREVLGLGPSFSEQELREAYRTKAKEHHPDRSGAESVWRMVEVNQAYHLLGTQERPAAASALPSRSGRDYELYRAGVKLFESIHPSAWIQVTAKGLFDPSVHETKVEPAVAFQRALQTMGEAYQVLSDVVRDYPASIWAADAGDKLKALDRMVERYKAMLRNGT